MRPMSLELVELMRDPPGRFHQGQRHKPRRKSGSMAAISPFLLQLQFPLMNRIGRVGKWGVTIYGTQLVLREKYLVR